MSLKASLLSCPSCASSIQVTHHSAFWLAIQRLLQLVHNSCHPGHESNPEPSDLVKQHKKLWWSFWIFRKQLVRHKKRLCLNSCCVIYLSSAVFPTKHGGPIIRQDKFEALCGTWRWQTYKLKWRVPGYRAYNGNTEIVDDLFQWTTWSVPCADDRKDLWLGADEGEIHKNLR